MAKQQVNEAVLLRTSAATDVQSSGGFISIAGLSSTWKKLLVSIKQLKYKAEVSQVVTIGAVDTAWVPVGSTTYGVLIGDSRRNLAGSESTPKLYSYTTSASLTKEGTTAALRREYINGKIVTAINNDPSNFGVAVSLGSGNGYTFTDDAGYNPLLLNDANLLYAQGQSGRQGKSTVQIWQNTDGSGYATTNISVTTAAVYAFGVGADLANGKPVMDFMYGNLIQGTLIAPPLTTAGLGAVSGQKYDAFVINSFGTAAAHNQTGQDALISKIKTVWVDNGTGSDTANLAGFKAIRRVFHKLMAEVYKFDASSVIEFFDQNFVIQGPLGAVPVTTTSLKNKFLTPYGLLNHYNIGTQTIVAPTQGSTGLLTDQDIATGDGAEYCPEVATVNSQEFVVGKSTAIAIFEYVVTDVTGANAYFGFRKKEAFQLDYNNYNDLATIGFTSTSGKFSTNGILANAATVTTTSTTTGATNAVSSLYVVSVDINGVVTCTADGVAYPVYSAGTTPMVFAAGTVLIPFFETTQITGTASVGVISEFFAVADDKLIA